MPITITTPPPHSIIGPGVALSWESDFTGPMPTGSTWLVEITADAEATQGVETWTLPFQTTSSVLIIEEPSTGFRSRNGYILQNGDVAHVQIQLRNDVGTVIDSGTAAPHWDTTAGLGYQAEALRSTISAGFTSTDRANLVATRSNTQVLMPSAAGNVAQALSSFLGDWPPDLTNRHGSILVSGSGAIARGTDPFVDYALGFEWHWNTIPAE